MCFRDLDQAAGSHLAFRFSLSLRVGVYFAPFQIRACLSGLAQDCPSDRKNPDHIDSGAGILSGDGPIRVGQAPHWGEAYSPQTG